MKQPNTWSKPADTAAAWSPVSRVPDNWSPDRSTTENYSYDEPGMTYDQNYVFYDYMQNNNTLNQHLETAWKDAVSA